MDIGGAYMKKQVLVLINKEETDILIELYPELCNIVTRTADWPPKQ